MVRPVVRLHGVTAGRRFLPGFSPLSLYRGCVTQPFGHDRGGWTMIGLQWSRPCDSGDGPLASSNEP